MAGVSHQCPVCGFRGLKEPPRPPLSGGGSYEICPSCGFQFGVTDDDRGISYAAWRQLWIDRGMPCASEGIVLPPPNWEPGAQLRALQGGRNPAGMTSTSISTEVERLSEQLGRWRNLQECPLHDFRWRQGLYRAEISFNYIWGRWVVASRPCE